ncbi:hypothetical protein MMC26_000128 [Xylographa opegraphella]|nr:hypothetical protein [Xylographa opegraphella]
MAANRAESSDDLYESHPSLSASLEDFENNEVPSPTFQLPSHRSGFKSDESEVDPASNSEGPWSPPAWKRADASSGWYRHQPYLKGSGNPRFSASASRSRETSPQYESVAEDKEDLTMPANIPLPRGSLSPVKERSPSPPPITENKEKDFGQTFEELKVEPASPENQSNYIRFALRAEVQQRTDSFELAISSLRKLLDNMAHARVSFSVLITTILSGIFLMSMGRFLLQPPPGRPVPDLVKVAGLASSFEPLLIYSENGMQQINNIQQTSVALWDLGETVRIANLTSAPSMSRELDGLSDSLNKLVTELTRFFANVDGDIDAILIVMDWAHRELAAIPPESTNSLSTVFVIAHNLFSRIGLLEDRTGKPTAIGTIVTELFGRTHTQQTRYTLQRTFVEFIGVLELSVDSELSYSNNLFSLFNTIDTHFDNIQRSTARASDDEARSESDFFSSLWSRVLGPNAARLRKYEKNRVILHNVRAKTVLNKNMLVEHNHRLMALKQNLEALRRILFSPLVQGAQGSTASVEEQIMRLDGTYQHMKQVREDQKKRVFEGLFGPRPWNRYGPLLGEEIDEGAERQPAIDG